MLEVIKETLIDSIKLLPFLFITYLIMEYIEHKISHKTKATIEKSGKFGPLIGSLLGILPQCGFSVAATNFYSARVITLGTLISIYLTTSDEMIPILLSEAVSVDVIFKILGIKLVVGIIAGFIIDLVIRLISNKKEENEEDKIEDICKHEHCHCEEGILRSSLKHTLSIFAFIIIITFIINTVIFFIGEDNLALFVSNNPIIAPILAGIIGLIPNCASSVILTQLYLQNVISVSAMLAGLFVGTGVGLAVLFKTNKNIKENIKIVILLYCVGVMAGIILQLIGFKI